MLLRKCSQVTGKRLIIIESVVEVKKNLYSRDSQLHNIPIKDQIKYACFIDWFYNRVLHQDVQVPYNYCSTLEWIQFFTNNGFSVDEVVDLGIDQVLVPEHHVLFVIEPKL